MVKQEKVLFVVYRPEWWGCFDSLCRQECDKEHVTCYVMPIPRYERDMDTKVLDMTKKHFHPEWLTELPDRAILADFTTFSLDQRFDRIYIHNPYDNACAMDSVEPVYYSGNLKSKTDKLIYVPHMLYMGGMPESMVHCPVYDNVDAIWLSDERVRYSLDVAYDSKVEMVPCGILEYLDKLNAEKESEQSSVEISRKKRLLYCVSYEDLFYGTEKQIQKMWDIFKYMETREDVELVFRPDEDIPSRYFTLHPEICRKYKELVAYFKTNHIGTYDESPNPYRAAVDADGIMTTGHPMCAMFSVQGKYVLSIDRESRPIPTEEDRCVPSLWATTVVEKEDELEIWFVPQETKLICKMVIPGGEIELVAEVPDEIVTRSNYIDIVRVGDCLYIAPFCTDGIWKYNLIHKKFSKIYLAGANVACMTRIVPYGEYLYFLPRMYPGIVKYHMQTEEMQIVDGWVEALEQYVTPECKKEPYFIWAIKQEENMLYMASAKGDVWMEVNLDTDEWRLENIGLGGKRFVNMCKDGDGVWLFPYGSREIIRWNCVTKEKSVVYTVGESEGVLCPYVFASDSGEVIIAFPENNNDILKIHKKQDREAEEVSGIIPCKKEDYLSEYLMQSKMGYQFVKQLRNKQILAYEYYDGAFIWMDEEFEMLEKIHCRLPVEEVRKQQDIIYEKTQCKDEFVGRLWEGLSFSGILDFFVRQESSVRKEIRSLYMKYISD